MLVHINAGITHNKIATRTPRTEIPRTDIHDLTGSWEVIGLDQFNGIARILIKEPIMEISMKIDIIIGSMSAKETHKKLKGIKAQLDKMVVRKTAKLPDGLQ